jgi:SNF2 family DNA or RNA helicase
MLLDNKSQGKVGDVIAQKLNDDADLAILSNMFSIYGFAKLNKQLAKIQHLRLAIPEASNNDVLELVGTASDRKFRNGLNMDRVAKACAAWLDKKAEIRTVSTAVPQNLFHIKSGDQTTAISGSSPFTSSGLGFTASQGHEMNTCFEGGKECENLLSWFDSIWNNSDSNSNAKKKMLDRLRQIYVDKSPELIYYQTLFNVFHGSIDEISEDKIIKTQTGIKETVVWNKLYQFQRDGVLGAINKLEQYNGCIIADSVGLGKTFEALAVIKYFELRNDRVLVLCPKKLRENWTLYTVNDKRNLLVEDRFNYDVLNHTDLSRTKGMSGEVNLQSLNWGNYDLIVIDESHNFRNNTPRKDGITRYGRLMQEVIQSGVKTKVLMLSATPVNNRMNDLKNQVAFITEGVDTALSETGITSVEQTLKKAQTRFNEWLKRDAAERTTASLMESLNFDYFKLLDTLTIARSRKHVEKYYDMSEIGKFPTRLKPINIKADIDASSMFSELKEVNKDIRRMNLAAFAPLRYILPEKREEYSRKYDMELGDGTKFRQLDREESLIHLMRVNLLKRMESSIHSFGLTVERMLAGVRGLLARIDDHEQSDVEELSIEDIEIDDQEFEPFLVGNKVKVLLHDVDRIRWRQELEEDEKLLAQLLRDAQEIDPSRDDKLLKLKKLIQGKIENPINDSNKKIIVFTAFADTANYLYENIASWAKTGLGVNAARVSGSAGCQTNMDGIRKDLSSIITSFSPISKERDKISPELTQEIDLLIATDCISEGQNLQDCDYLVNYDIHWNPVRIIQRFGRVDRLGSRNDQIQLVNFWPNMELDEYINLEARVSGRMVLLDISATGEENVINEDAGKKMNDLEYRRKQLEQLQNEVVDMEDLSNGISITDMTLNDFRMNLGDYIKQNKTQLDEMPIGIYSVTDAQEPIDGHDVQPGAIFCLRSESDKIRVDSSYALAPHFLVYVNDAGEVLLNFTQARRILDLVKKLSIGQQQPIEPAIATFNTTTRNGRDMAQYRKMLSAAVTSITGKAEEKGVESLFQRGGTVLSKNAFRGIEDFEVVSYLVIVEPSGEAGGGAA